MLYETFLSSLSVFMFCLSFLLLHRVSVLESDLHKLQGNAILQLNHLSEGDKGNIAKTSQTREVCLICSVDSSWILHYTDIYAVSEYSDRAATINLIATLCFLSEHEAKSFPKSSEFSEDLV